MLSFLGHRVCRSREVLDPLLVDAYISYEFHTLMTGASSPWLADPWRKHRDPDVPPSHR